MKTIKLNETDMLSDALSLAEKGDTILLYPKVYQEKIVISIDNLTIIGSEKSKIVYGDYAKKIHFDGMEYNTFRTYTVMVLGKNVTFKNFEIENNSYSPKEKGQAVALSVSGNNFYCSNMVLKSAQDTLFLAPLPDDLIFRYDGFLLDCERYIEGEVKSFFENVTVLGSVDFVFGCGNAFFNNCSFISIDDMRSTGYVAAPAHSLKQKYGFTFYNCDFLAEVGLTQEVFLARPWRDYGKCSFISCRLGKHISEKGFDKWNDTARDRTARFSIYKSTPLKHLVNWCKVLSSQEAETELIENNIKIST